MPKQTLKQMKEFVQDSADINPEKRNEIIDLLKELETEVDQLPKVKQEEAKAVIELAHQKLKSLKGMEPKDIPYGDLEDAALQFEVSHPKFTAAVQSICQSLSSLGI